MNFFTRILGILLFLTLGIYSATVSQNLVSNGGFESYTGGCPSAAYDPPTGRNFKATDWTYISAANTPDIFNSCSGCSGFCPSSNTFGAQSPRTGQGYAGFQFYNVAANPYGEYLIYEFDNALIPNTQVTIGFYVSLGDNSQYYLKKVGAKLVKSLSDLTSGQPSNSDGFFHLSSDVSSSNWVSNKTGWTQIQGTVNVSDSYNYLVIGAFDNQHLATNRSTNTGGSFNERAYYYVDDVSVTCPSLNANNISIASPTDLDLCYNEWQTVKATYSGINDNLLKFEFIFPSSYTQGQTNNFINVKPIAGIGSIINTKVRVCHSCGCSAYKTIPMDIVTPDATCGDTSEL